MDDSSRSSPFAIVIDDSLFIRKNIAACLRRKRIEGRKEIEVEGYADPLEALRAMAGPGARMPDLVFIAAEFPQSPLNSLTAVKILRSRATAQELPIIMIARPGHKRTLGRLFARLAGANEYLVKPLTRQAIQEMAERYIKQA